MAELGVWTIPGYVVHERLQAGLVSAAYLASRTSDGYPVLLQVVSEEFSDPLSADHFRTTIERISAVRHPVVPTVSEVGEADGLLYTISTAVEGRSLDATLRSQGTLPLDDTLAVCRELADALDMLASAGIVHGAVSPTTVWINDRVRSPSAPYVSLRGFGTTPLRARRIQDPAATPPPDVAYTAPEQVRGSAPVEGTDQYALACMVLHCLTGSPPFERGTIDELFDAHVAHEPDDAVLHADRLPGRLVTGLRRALAKEPAERFASCTEFATAVGATGRPSWTWMLEAGQKPGEIDIRDEVMGGGAGLRPATSPSGSRTARSLSEVDWLPGSATRPGPRQPVPAPGAAAAGRGPNPVATPGRHRRVTARHARWIGVAVLAVVVAAAGLALVRAMGNVDRTGGAADTADQPTGDGAPEIAASWREPVADGPVDLLAAEEDGVLSVVGAAVVSLDQETGRPQWSTELDASPSELSVLGPTVILRTPSQFVALDRADGSVLWRSSDTGMPDLDAFITGRGRMFGVARDAAGDVAVHAIDPTSGDVGWTVTTPGPANGGRDGDAPALIAFDGSEHGQRSLYVADGDLLSAYAVTTRELRWQITLEGGAPVSMTALAGAILTVSGDGEVCRYHADDGEAAWTACARLERVDDRARIAQVRDSRVIVAGEHEVLSVDFTTGRPSWRIVSEEALQPVITANRAATYIAAPDGSVEAIAQRNGASLWESAPFGPISAMSATDEAVYLTTSDGRLTRLEAPDAPDRDG